MKIIILTLSAFLCLVTTGLYAFDDPFDSPPANLIRNCSEEYRFKYTDNITTPEAFIEFLKKHQGGNKYFTVPTKERLIPKYVEHDPSFDVNAKAEADESKIKVDLNRLTKRVEIIELQNSMHMNKKIYRLSFGWGIYSGDPYAWRISVQMSDNGDVSIQYCAGK